MPGDQWEYDFRIEHEHPLEALREHPSLILGAGEAPAYVEALRQRSEAQEREAGPFLLPSSESLKAAGETTSGSVAVAVDRGAAGMDPASRAKQQGAPGLFGCGCSHPAQGNRTSEQVEKLPVESEAARAYAGGLRLNEFEPPLPTYLRTLSRLCERAAERLEEQANGRGVGASRFNGLQEMQFSTEPMELFASSIAEKKAPETQGETLAMNATNTGLSSCANAAANDPVLAQLSSMVVDLTGNPASVPFAGHQQDEMLYVASLAKIYPMYAAFTLRRMVESQAKQMIHAGLSTTVTGWELKVFAELRKTLEPRLQAAFPKLPVNFPALASIFWLSDAGDASFVEQAPMLTDAALDRAGEFSAPPGKFRDWMRLMLRWSNDAAASRMIRALGYSMINFALETGGFFDRGTQRGLWMSGDYEGNDWVRGPGNLAGQALDSKWAKLQGRAKSNFTGTAFQVARMLALLGKGALVDATSSAEMIDIMTGADGIGSYIRGALTGGGRGFSKVSSKIGFGDEKVSHDCALVRIDREDGPPILFVEVILGSVPSRHRTGLKQLALGYYDCVTGLHP